MAKLKYYYNLLSQPSRAIYAFIKKTEIPFEGKVVDLLKGNTDNDSYDTLFFIIDLLSNCIVNTFM